MRHFDWQTRLSQYLDGWRYQPFNFKTHNCLFFAFGAIKAVNDVDLLPIYEARSNSITDGARALREIDGVTTVEDCLKVHLAQEFQPITFARPGDIVFLENENEAFELATDMRLFGPVPGVCYGVNSFFLGEFGMVSVPTMMADKALWVS